MGGTEKASMTARACARISAASELGQLDERELMGHAGHVNQMNLKRTLGPEAPVVAGFHKSVPILLLES